MTIHESRALLPTITVRAFIRCRTTMPSADFYCEVKASCDAFSHESATHSRSPEVSSTAFRTQPPNLQPAPLMDMGFAVIGQLARHRMPLIRFLYIGSYVCSTLLSDPASRRRPCASLSLHLHQVVKRTFTFELSNMLGTQQCGRGTCSTPTERRERDLASNGENAPCRFLEDGAVRCIRFCGQFREHFDETLWLADEKSVGDERVDESPGINLSRRRRADHRTRRQIGVDELARHGKDQVRLQQR